MTASLQKIVILMYLEIIRDEKMVVHIADVYAAGAVLHPGD